MTAKIPNVKPGTHPVETSRYLLVTPMIERLRDYVFHWVNRCATGGIVYGLPRDGKTRAGELIFRQLPEHFPGIVCQRHLCRQVIHPTEKAFFSGLLSSVGSRFADQGTASQKRLRLQLHIKDLILRSGQRRIVLLIDEAQRLNEDQYEWLIDISNELDEERFCLTTLLVGQPEIMAVKAAFVARKRKQIVGRFMMEAFPFKGIRSKDELEVCLKCYDDSAFFPDDNDEWSYTRYFARKHFDSGWRLAAIAEHLWQVFDEIRRVNKLPSKSPEISMQEFCRTAESILLKIREVGNPDINTNLLSEIVLRAGYGIPWDLGELNES